MQYNRLNGIVQKALKYTLNGQDKGYTLNYEYNNKKHPHAPSLIANSQLPKARSYQYDGNGNPTYYDEFKGFRSMVWDEENRLRGINDNGRLHLYTYDHTGERALKSSAESSMAVINGLASAVITHTEDYTAYVSPYFVVQKGKFTKHYFEGSSRVVSKLGEGTFSHKNTGIMAGGLDYLTRSKKEEEVRQRYIKGLQVPPGPPTQHGIYASPEWTKQPYPSIDWSEISQNQEPPQGWPRYPRFNEPGDVPGPPVQFGPPVTNANVKAGYGFIPNGVEEKNLYYYHPDHLGSSSYITDKNGEIIQHTEYIAFGETFVDEHSTSNKQPYLFNGKELDYETGLYYYGARYYDPKTSLWLNTDPLSGYNPIQEVEHYIDGQHNGGIYNFGNLNTYTYTYQNPIRYIDPNGKQYEPAIVKGQYQFRGAPSLQPKPIYTTPRPISPVSSSTGRGILGTIGTLGTRFLAGGFLLFSGTLHAPAPQRVEDMIELPKYEPIVTLYRGVSSDYRTKRYREMYNNAKIGIAIPLGLLDNFIGTPHESPELHAQGNNFSIYTSWTTSKEVAKKFAMGRDGKFPGVILSKDFKLSEVFPNNSAEALKHNEQEWLVPGIVTGAKVEKIQKDK